MHVLDRVLMTLIAGAVAFALTAGIGVRAEPDAAGLVAAYAFDENAGTVTADSSGNGLTATLVGAVWTPAGKFGSALAFDGLASRVTVIDDSPALRLTGAMTLEAWVKPAAASNTWGDIIYKGNDNYFLMASSPPSGFDAAGGIFGTANVVLYDTTAIPAGAWTYLAATYDGARIRLYVNGVLATSRTQTGTLKTSGYPLQVGADSFFGQGFHGTIDEVRVYNRALSAIEIQADMNARVADPIADSIAPGAPGPAVTNVFSGTEIRLTWPASTDNVGIGGYRIERCRGNGCESFTEIATSSAPSLDDTNLARNTVYRYRVRAADLAGNLGAYGPIATAATLSTAAVPGLVAAYAFDEGQGGAVTDLSGTGNNGVVANTDWTGAGRFGGALVFNGTNSWVTVNDAPSLHLTTAMTLEAWVNPATIPAPNCTVQDCHWKDVIVKQTDGYYIEASSDINSQPEVGGIFAQKHIIFAPDRLSVNAWTHIALAYDGAFLTLYVNGALVARAAESGTLTQSTKPLRIGGDSDYVQFFNGMIDEVRVYNRGLSGDEIRGDMLSPLGSAFANPMPAAVSLDPPGAIARGAGFELIVHGSGFVPGSLVAWNGSDRPTTFVDAGTLRAGITAGDIATAQTVQVGVYNPPPLGGTSAELSLPVCTGSTWYVDADGDGHGDATQSVSACTQPAGTSASPDDCDDGNASVWSVPGEVQAVSVDSTMIAWTAPVVLGSSSIGYDILRSPSPTDFDAAAECIASGDPDLIATDGSSPEPAATFFYLILARNACGRGTPGLDSAGTERAARSCP